ncbi:MAG: LysR family transcriptional regulator [Faecousia sp.]
MNTIRLHEFLVLSKVLNYSKAASALYISQSVLTKHIQDLEQEIGAPLLQRTTHGVALTQAGRLLAKEAQPLINKCDSALRRLRSRSLPTKGTVRIAISLEFSYSAHIRQFCQDFASRYPDIELFYDVMSGNTPSCEAEKHDIFFTPCTFLDLPQHIRQLPVRAHGTELILPPNHPLMSRQAVYLHQLSGQTIIVPYAEEPFGPYAQNYMLAEKATKGQVSIIKVDNLHTALFLTGMGKGVCIAPRYAKNLMSMDTFTVTISDRNCRFDEYLYYNESGNGAAMLFCEEFQALLEP